MRSLVSIAILLFFPFMVFAQPTTEQWLPMPAPQYGFINYTDNDISYTNRLDSFYRKLVQLKHTHTGKVSIVHIGDSHIQADGITSMLRNEFQAFFGDAGRGLVFPYQLANSNAPLDIKAASNVVWKSNRLTSPDKPIKTGISGFGIHSNGKNATVNIKLKEMEGRQSSFNSMLLFLCNDSVCYRVTDSSLARPILFGTPNNLPAGAIRVNTDNMMTGFELCKVSAPTECNYSFYGVSLEKKDSAGVLYHSIGVNGARYDQFVRNTDFFEQLAALQADLFVISLGTNEAQNPTVVPETFTESVSAMIAAIRKIAPKAAILLTTPPASYFRMKKPNATVQKVAEFTNKYCAGHLLPCWDLFNISSGMAGAPQWKKNNLLAHDLVHFTTAGYQLQGLLLTGALAQGYNSYERQHPYKAPAPVVPKTVKPTTKKPLVIKEEIEKMTIQRSSTYGKDTTDKKLNKPAPDSPLLRTNKKSNIKVEYSGE